jgi:integrase
VLALNNDLARDYFLLVILTGLRRTEALNLRWDNVDLMGRTLTVRDTKNHQDHTLPLSDYPLELLEVRQREAVGKYVFEGPRGQLSNLRYVMATVIERSGVTFTTHDLRRTFATVADSLDIPGYAVKALLNHKTGADVTAGYIIADVERLRGPMQRITDYLLRAGGLRESAEVISIKTA